MECNYGSILRILILAIIILSGAKDLITAESPGFKRYWAA